jgi:outer membrane lipoprotein SlyB
MEIKTIHKAARTLTTTLTIAGAALGSIAGLAASMWGGIFIVVPLATALFGVAGSLLGAVIEAALRLKWPLDYGP